MVRAHLLRAALAGAALLAASVPQATAQTEAPDDGGPPAGRPSLEGLRRAIRFDLGQQRALAREALDELVGALDRYESEPGATTRAARRDELLALGPATRTLLAPYLDPFWPEAPKGTMKLKWRRERPGVVARAEIVADALREAPSVATTELLLALVLESSFEGRMNALRALEASPDSARVLEVLRPFTSAKPASAFEAIPEYRSDSDGSSGSQGPNRAFLRAAAVRTIASLATPDSDRFLLTLLRGRPGDPGMLRDAAAEALKGGDLARTAPLLLDLARSETGWGAAESIAEFYDANDALLGDLEHSEAILSLSLDPRVADVHRAALFDLLRETDTKIAGSIKRKIEQRYGDDDASAFVRVAAKKLLARRGSRSAKRDLLAPYDDRIRNRSNVTGALAQRAELLHELGEWNAALRDWRQVIESERMSSWKEAMLLGYARTLSRAKKYRDARDVLQRTSLSLAQLRGLATDRDFREMAASRYSDAFHLESDG
ncbi:MAG: hypothetical protein AAFU73_08925 [Planctomycetota bacterium]